MKNVFLEKLILKDEKVKIIPQFQLDSIKEQYLIIDKILSIHKSFKSILLGKDSKKLDEWILVLKNNIVQLTSFIKIINDDLIAVKNAIDNKLNNGFAEGKVNLLKTN